MLQHLVLPYQHLRFRLVECALVPPAERRPLAQVHRADRRGPQPGRRPLASSPARSPRPAVQVGSRHVEGAARVTLSRRLRERARGHRETGLRGGSRLREGARGHRETRVRGRCGLRVLCRGQIRDGAGVVRSLAGALCGMELLELELLLADHLEETVLMTWR